MKVQRKKRGNALAGALAHTQCRGAPRTYEKKPDARIFRGEKFGTKIGD
jgi:hypothetical protein